MKKIPKRTPIKRFSSKRLPTEVTGEAREMLALAFEGIGGLPELMKWAKTHRTAFYNHYTKLLPMTLNANATVDVKEDRAELEASMTNLMTNLMLAHEVEDAERARAAGIVIEEGETYRDALERIVTGGTIIDHKPQAAIVDNVSPGPPAPAANVRPETPAAAPQSAAPAAANVVPLRNVARSAGSSVPGLNAGVALDKGSDDLLSTTERFYLWNGHGRPP
ncbi:hypothetical protein [Bradyrhizobium diazoefficiens]